MLYHEAANVTVAWQKHRGWRGSFVRQERTMCHDDAAAAVEHLTVWLLGVSFFKWVKSPMPNGPMIHPER